MPKSFSPREKELIRVLMREKGRALFENRGIKKTSVDELAQAAGISKGAFYLFYESKEELLLEILEQIEADIQSGILNCVLNRDKNAAENAARILSSMLLTWDKYPLLKKFSRSDFEYLARKIPPERALAHAQRDEEFARNFLKKLKKENIKTKVSPRVATNLMKSLFFMGLHREDLGENDYKESIEIMIGLVAKYITEE